MLLGLDWRIGAIIGALAMVGDLFSSFVKRRLGLRSGSPALGLDQVPEALFPLLACRIPLSLTAAAIASGVAIFFVGAVFLSRVLYAFDLRERPY
jgi:CDP-diglyceride synthetase